VAKLTCRKDRVTSLSEQLCQDLRVAGGIYRVPTQGGAKCCFKPERSGWVGKNFVNAW
jgi:hypothetical protein